MSDVTRTHDVTNTWDHEIHGTSLSDVIGSRECYWWIQDFPDTEAPTSAGYYGKFWLKIV